MCLYRSTAVLGLFDLNLFESLHTIVQQQGITGIGPVFPSALSPSCCSVFSSAVAAVSYPQVCEGIPRPQLFQLWHLSFSCSWHQPCRLGSQGHWDCRKWDARADEDAGDVCCIKAAERCTYCRLPSYDRADGSSHRDPYKAGSWGKVSEILCQYALR